MTTRPIGVGIIGARADRGWAAMAHIPALAAVPEFKLVALSTSRPETARAAGDRFGVPLAFSDHRELVARPEVDLVVVAVKVPHHLQLVRSAIEAGKAVYCEWPLGRDLAEAEAMAEAARARQVPAFVGLQSRSAPALRHVRQLVRGGYVGEVLSTTMVGSGMQWSASTDVPNAYTNDRSTGATMLTIPFGHAIDALCWTLGEFQQLAATTAIRRPRVSMEGAEDLERTACDQVAVSGILDGGAVACVHYRGGTSPGTNLLWEINGTKGDLRITAASGHLQMASPVVEGSRGGAALAVLATHPEHLLVPSAPEGRAFNIAHVYARLARHFQELEPELPTFADAVRRHRLLADIEARAGH